MSRISALYDAYLRKSPRQSRSRSVVEAILAAAAEKISGSENEEQVTIQDIAHRAGVGVGSLYDYFRDRRSLLAALAAKITEDNLRSFEQVLASTEGASLDDSLKRMIDFCFDLYATDKRIGRSIMKIAHSIGLMPTLAQSQTVFAESLAASLRKRSEATTVNVELAAWTATQAMMGVIQTLLWQDEPKYTRDELRAELFRLFAPFLRRDADAAGTTSGAG